MEMLISLLGTVGRWALVLLIAVIVGSFVSTWLGQVAYTVTSCVLRAVRDGLLDKNQPQGAAKQERESEDE